MRQIIIRWWQIIKRLRYKNFRFLIYLLTLKKWWYNDSLFFKSARDDRVCIFHVFCCKSEYSYFLFW